MKHKTLSNVGTETLSKAAALGSAAFAKGIKCAPALDVDYMPLLRTATDGTPGASIGLADAWLKGWHSANLAD